MCSPVRGLEAPAGLASVGRSTAGRAWATPRACRPDNAGTSSPKEAKGEREEQLLWPQTQSPSQQSPSQQRPGGFRDAHQGRHLPGESESSSLFQTQIFSIVSPASWTLLSPRP